MHDRLVRCTAHAQVVLLGAILTLMPIANAGPLPLLDFSMPELVTQFGVINDGVMGGVSTSRLRPAAGAMVFEGEISLENNGGFASFRGPVKVAALPTTLLLTVRGDGRRYKLTLKLDDSALSSQYQAAFVAPREWQTLRFEPADFAASFRGRPVTAPPVRFVDVRYVGLLISDKHAGGFKVELKDLKAE
ncbi:MAG: CIA30 family protein [Betaproteobacteria bacterium]